MAFVFVSYSKHNAAYVGGLVRDLIQRGFNVWIDDRSLRSSEKWWVSIVEAIGAADAFIVVLTEESDASDWVQKEIFLALRRRLRIYPLWLSGEITTPNWDKLIDIQYYDVHGGRLPDEGFYEALAEAAPPGDSPGHNITHTGPLPAARVAQAPSLITEALADPPTDVLHERLRVRRLRALALVGVPLLLLASVGLALLNPPSPGDITPTAATATTALTDVVSPVPTVDDHQAVTLASLSVWWAAQGLPPLQENNLLRSSAENYLAALMEMRAEDIEAIPRHEDRIETDFAGRFEAFVAVGPQAATLRDVWNWFLLSVPGSDASAYTQIGVASTQTPFAEVIVLLLGAP